MVFDKLSLFADGLAVKKDAGGTTLSKVIDFRKSTFIDPALRIYAQTVGAANDAVNAGAVTTVVQVSDDGATWKDILSAEQDGMYLCRVILPIANNKRFMRLAFKVGEAALDKDITVKAGLVDQFDMTEADGVFPKVQTFPPLEDLPATTPTEG